MTYYPTLAEDLARAKAILAKGSEQVDPQLPAAPKISAGHIYAADIYPAYKLLESFVDQIERLHQLWHQEGLEHSECQEALLKAQAEIADLQVTVAALRLAAERQWREKPT